MSQEKSLNISSDPEKIPPSESPHSAFEHEDILKTGLSSERGLETPEEHGDGDAGLYPKV